MATSSNCFANPTQSVVNTTLGPLVMGLMLQQFWLGIIAVHGVRYYEQFGRRDDGVSRYLVAALLILNALEAAMDIHVLFRTTVTHYGDYTFVDLQEWTTWAEPGVTAIIGFLAHLFFLARCWRATNKSLVIFASLTFLVLLSLGSGLAVSVYFLQVKLFTKLANLPIPVCFWLVSTAAADTAIALTLSVELLKGKTSSFKRPGGVVKKIVRLAVETGGVTAITAMLNLVLYLAKKSTEYHLLPQYSLCRIYTMTVLVALLERDWARDAYSSFALSGPIQERTVNKLEVKVGFVLSDTSGG
ncbi:hypothetical protein B0H13DRAFT_1641469 [Mycena leptocephala]|nr:hypothetical protein B0H13DRAFT_1641469 [Mycena leptocephala]